MSDTLNQTRILASQLQNSKLYPFPIQEFKLIETHVSLVILTGTYAYKIKKPVDFEFLNFTTLEQRHHFCQKELELNQRLAPHLYLSVVPIYGTPENPSFEKAGDPIEYAIQMREFSQSCLLDVMLQNQQLDSSHIEALAKTLADFHKKTPVTHDDYYGSYPQIHEPVLQNFEQITALLENSEAQADIEFQKNWANQQYHFFKNDFLARKQQGFIRECHGDCHLGNMIWLDQKPIIFDCIEFNESFRVTDTMADVGFFTMDLCDKDRPDLANFFLNSYLEYSQDYDGLSVYPYYFAYRAIVRAKIALFDLHYSQHNEQEKSKIYSHYQHLVRLANQFALQATQPQSITLTYGLSGSGKTFKARQLAQSQNLIHLRSDAIRKIISGIDLYSKNMAPINGDLYSFDMHDQTYAKLYEITEKCLRAGFSVVIDASFIKKKYRDRFYQLAQSRSIQFHIISCEQPLETLKQRIQQRGAAQSDISDAYLDVLEMQAQTIEALDATEQKCLLHT